MSEIGQRLRALATRQNVGRLRKIGHGQKRHPETVALFDALADILESLGVHEPVTVPEHPGYCLPSLGEPCGQCHRCCEDAR